MCFYPFGKGGFMLIDKRKSHKFQRTLNEKHISCRRIMRESVESVRVEDVASALEDIGYRPTTLVNDGGKKQVFVKFPKGQFCVCSDNALIGADGVTCVFYLDTGYGYSASKTEFLTYDDIARWVSKLRRSV
jgi:signal recognition particle subunit SEC65